MGIVAVLIGLLLPAVAKVRLAATTMQAANQMKQIGIAFHAYASDREGRLPAMGISSFETDSYASFSSILPYIEQGGLVTKPFAPAGGGAAQSLLVRVRLYESPADPSFGGRPSDQGFERGNCSYAANMLAFMGDPNLSRTFADGTSNTVAFAEHYARCSPRAVFGYDNASATMPAKAGSTIPNQRRATFADRQVGDVYPVTTNDPPTTVGSAGGATFQLRPALDACDPSIPQGLHPGGMLTAFVDGSVRTLSASASPASFWAAVTPSGGEVAIEW
jgi:hypothetical protein